MDAIELRDNTERKFFGLFENLHADPRAIDF